MESERSVRSRLVIITGKLSNRYGGPVTNSACSVKGTNASSTFCHQGKLADNGVTEAWRDLYKGQSATLEFAASTGSHYKLPLYKVCFIVSAFKVTMYVNKGLGSTTSGRSDI